MCFVSCHFISRVIEASCSRWPRYLCLSLHSTPPINFHSCQHVALAQHKHVNNNRQIKENFVFSVKTGYVAPGKLQQIRQDVIFFSKEIVQRTKNLMRVSCCCCFCCCRCWCCFCWLKTSTRELIRHLFLVHVRLQFRSRFKQIKGLSPRFPLLTWSWLRCSHNSNQKLTW